METHHATCSGSATNVWLSKQSKLDIISDFKKKVAVKVRAIHEESASAQCAGKPKATPMTLSTSSCWSASHQLGNALSQFSSRLVAGHLDCAADLQTGIKQVSQMENDSSQQEDANSDADGLVKQHLQLKGCTSSASMQPSESTWAESREPSSSSSASVQTSSVESPNFIAHEHIDGSMLGQGQLSLARSGVTLSDELPSQSERCVPPADSPKAHTEGVEPNVERPPLDLCTSREQAYNHPHSQGVRDVMHPGQTESSQLPRRQAEPVSDETADKYGHWRSSLNRALKFCHTKTGFADREEEAILRRSLDLPETAQDSRITLLEFGSKHIFVTAPHTIFLLRDGHSPHARELFTDEIGSGLAQALDGTYLTWNSEEKKRSEVLWKLSKKLHGKKCASSDCLLDPQNRDPNFLLKTEIQKNLWYQTMQATATDWRAEQGGAHLLHLDVHGSKDPPDIDAHCTLGLGAMYVRAEENSNGPDKQGVAQFGAALRQELIPVMKAMRLQPSALVLRVAMEPRERTSALQRFAGVCEDGSHMTQTQQAMLFPGFSHSVQLEMSKAMRTKLNEHPDVLGQFASAIHKVWKSIVDQNGT